MEFIKVLGTECDMWGKIKPNRVKRTLFINPDLVAAITPQNKVFLKFVRESDTDEMIWVHETYYRDLEFIDVVDVRNIKKH